ncbi:transketolase [Geobacter pelophilus]|uniref:Transketolase n=1 Tax=Geoanaerobacter pelophilus TaxID=60036 RepID=A0AAW4L6W3_9BACT|nr:transketolase [Geoanaerobacter pelophilus]MBT0665912.1 transketolase [Geoanaerobacter pelophilus]
MDEELTLTSSDAALDELCINTIRFLALDAVQAANSGHPGMPMGAASLAYALWMGFHKHNPANPDWIDRDRFVLSAGHGSMLLYALLHLTGYDLSLDDIKRFRQRGSRAPGHPERGVTPGVETTTGPLGQGFGNAVGMAIAEAHLAASFNRPDLRIIDHFTYCLTGDGDLMEGISAEAASLAGHLRLGKLVCFYDDNRISLAGATALSCSEQLGERFAAYGWHVQTVVNGNDLDELRRAIQEAKGETAAPSLIMVRTHIGFGSPHKQDRFEAHGSPLGPEELALTKHHLGWPLEPLFHIPETAENHFRKAREKGAAANVEWDDLFRRYQHDYPEAAAELKRIVSGKLPHGWDQGIPRFPADPKGMATRSASGIVMNALAPALPELVGGSADLNPSTLSALSACGDFQSPAYNPVDRQGAVGGEWGYAARNIHFGVREHAMGAIINGLAAHGGCIPYGATFLVFADYLRPSIRLAALMGLHLVYVFTHDSIAVGEDGPTHQPVEQLASLRAIPGLTVIRPADANEAAAVWQLALKRNDGPIALILTRQAVPTLDRESFAPADAVEKGAYILADAPDGNPELLLIASGSEVGLIIAARERLLRAGVAVRVVSMPSWELFEEQPQDYRDKVLPPAVKARLAVECGIAQGWHRYVGDGGEVIGVSGFGASAPGPVVYAEYGFTAENVCARALALLSRTKAGSN